MKTYSHNDRSPLAFTLVEMLTVITIMAIIAALVVTMGQSASRTKKVVAVNGEKERLVNLIENYKAKMNFYPPDNGGLISNTLNLAVYDALAATNPLMYELTGVTNVTGGSKQQMVVFNSTSPSQTLLNGTFAEVFNRAGVANCDASEPQDFFQPGPAPKEYSTYMSNSPPALSICGLVVPIEFTNAHIANFWHYDSSTTNRHNMNSFDLWSEFSMGNKNGRPLLQTNGNF